MPNDEWGSPPEYVEPARKLFGGLIDLDPASNDLANTYIVRATLYYDQEVNGLLKPWRGRVWCNPPYSTGLPPQFATKAHREYTIGNLEEGILLVNTASETAWYKFLARRYPLLFTEKRIGFLQAEQREEGGLTPVRINGYTFYKGEQNRVGQTLFYLGSNVEGFYRAYEGLAYPPMGSIQAVLQALTDKKGVNHGAAQ